MTQRLSLRERPRRNRKSAALRDAVRETTLGPERFIYPLFVHEGDAPIPIGSMPGCVRHSRASLLQEVERAVAVGVRMVALFPAIPDAQKDPRGTGSYDPDGLVPRTIAALKERWPQLVVVTDVALDPYSSDGHDGIVAPDGRILNDETVEVLCKQALCQARAGADVIAPSDMMDGRVGAIRDALDDEGFSEVSILAYTAKYASAFYGPFRDAVESQLQGDRRTYQLDPGNGREGVREALLDLDEGADIVMVKPALAYLDVLRQVADISTVPVWAYMVSGEYAMIQAAARNHWIDGRRVMLESLTSIKRAGANLILTYFAKDAARALG